MEVAAGRERHREQHELPQRVEVEHGRPRRVREAQAVPLAGPQRPAADGGDEHAEDDGVEPQHPPPPFEQQRLQLRDEQVLDVPRGLLEGADDAIGAVDAHLLHAVVDLLHVDVALRLEPLPQRVVVDGHGGGGVVDAVETARGQPLLGEGALPRGDDVLRVVLARGGVDLVQDVQELAGIGPADGLRHEVVQGVPHGAGLGMAGVEEHQHEVGEVDDVVRDAEDRRALVIGVEAGRVDDDLAPDLALGAGLQLQVGVDAPPLAGRQLLDGSAQPVEREARVGVEGEPRQHPGLVLLPVADDREAVVHGLVPGDLQRLPDIVVDEGRLAGRVGAQHGDHRPPGDARGERLLGLEEPEAMAHPVELAEARDGLQQDRVLLGEVFLQAPQALLQLV